MYSNIPLPWVIESANKGDANSQLALGMLCYSPEIMHTDITSITLDKFIGLSAKKNKSVKQAEFWFRKSSEKSEPLSTLLLAYTMELRKTTVKEKLQILNLYLTALKNDNLSEATVQDTKYRIALLNLFYLNKEKGETQLRDINLPSSPTNLIKVDFS